MIKTHNARHRDRFTSNASPQVLPLANVTPPLTFSVPAPGANVPPLPTVTAGTVPVPASVPPEFTVTPLEPAMDPLTVRVPLLMLVAPL